MLASAALRPVGEMHGTKIKINQMISSILTVSEGSKGKQLPARLSGYSVLAMKFLLLSWSPSPGGQGVQHTPEKFHSSPL